MIEKKLRLSIRDLDYLRQLAIDKNFTTAAKECMVSQPTLSTQIKKIEEHLGVTIFERDNKNVLITPIGERIIAQANRVLASANQLHTIAMTDENPYVGPYQLGIIPTLSSYILPHIFEPIKNELKQLNMVIHEEQQSFLLQKLADGALDAVIISGTVGQDSAFKQKHLFREPLSLICSHRNKRVKRSTVETKDLIHEKILLLDNDQCLRSRVINVLNVKTHQLIQNNCLSHLESVKTLVEADQGVSVFPKLATHTLAKSVDVIDFHDSVGAYRDIYMVSRNRNIRKLCYERLYKLIKEHTPL